MCCVKSVGRTSHKSENLYYYFLFLGVLHVCLLKQCCLAEPHHHSTDDDVHLKAPGHAYYQTKSSDSPDIVLLDSTEYDSGSIVPEHARTRARTQPTGLERTELDGLESGLERTQHLNVLDGTQHLNVLDKSQHLNLLDGTQHLNVLDSSQHLNVLNGTQHLNILDRNGPDRTQADVLHRKAHPDRTEVLPSVEQLHSVPPHSFSHIDAPLHTKRPEGSHELPSHSSNDDSINDSNVDGKETYGLNAHGAAALSGFANADGAAPLSGFNGETAVRPAEHSIHRRHLDTSDADETLSNEFNSPPLVHSVHRRDLEDISDNSLNDLLNGDDVSSSNNRLSHEFSRQILSNNYYERISPTRTSDDVLYQQDIKDSRQPGEGQRVLSKGRSLLARPRNLSSETSSQSGVSEGQGHIGEGQTGESHDVEGRTEGQIGEGQGEGAVVTPRSGNGGSNSKNPDFQEILTGFVKLLNGQTGRPGMPPRTRINNRGPPRITDVPPILFESPQGGAPSTPPVPFIPLHTSSDFPYTFEPPAATGLPFPEGASQADQIQPTKPLSPGPSDSNVNIFQQRPSIQYVNPSALPTIPDDLRPPTPPQHPNQHPQQHPNQQHLNQQPPNQKYPNPQQHNPHPNPQHPNGPHQGLQHHPKPDGPNGHHPPHHSKPPTSSQRPNVRPESNGYRPDFIEPTKQGSHKDVVNGQNFVKDPMGQNYKDPAGEYGGNGHGVNGIVNGQNGLNNVQTHGQNGVPNTHGQNGESSSQNIPTNGQNQNAVPTNNQNTAPINSQNSQSQNAIPTTKPLDELPTRETFGSIFDSKIPKVPADGESPSNAVETKPLFINRPDSNRPENNRPDGPIDGGLFNRPESGVSNKVDSGPSNRPDNGNRPDSGSNNADKPSRPDKGQDKVGGSGVNAENKTTESKLNGTESLSDVNTLTPVYKPDKPLLPIDTSPNKPTKDSPAKKPQDAVQKKPLNGSPLNSGGSQSPIAATPVSAAGSIQSTSRPRINATAPSELELGQGIAAVIEGLLEPSLLDTEVKPTRLPTPPVKRPPPPAGGYYPRPGIVLDDTEYKPAGHRRPHPPPIITAAPPTRVQGDIFDVTVSAIQGPGGEGNGTKTGQAFVYPVELEGANSDVITTAQNGQHFVSIDGKRTYMNLFGGSGPAATQDVAVKPTPAGSYGLSPLQTQAPSGVAPSSPGATSPGGSGARPPAWRKPAHPPVRIDTCIVGDDTTCDVAQHERCRTEVGVSSCHCRPGYSRRKHREPCHRIVSIGMSLRVDKLFDQRLTWSEKYKDPESEEYQYLEFEAIRAMDSAMSMTPFSDIFMAARIHNIYPAKNNGLTLNMTLQLAENADTLRPPITGELSKHVQGVIHRRQNNVGNSALWVDNSPGVVSLVQDINECSSPELNDCSPAARCTNVFGSFQCTCPEGTRDPWVGNLHQSGRTCESCDPSNCNHRGTCSYQTGQPVCKCSGSFYGAQCEIDGEVLGVAIGASVCALLIILVTLMCLCSWSRRWNREQKIGSPVFGYMPQGGSTVKTPAIGGPPYQVSLEDRLRWAQIADAMAHANHYAPEPVVGTMNSTRPSSAMFGYSLPHHPVPLPRLRPPASQLRTPESSTSEEEDRTDLLGRNFQVPRPKSRSSVANQSGIYYDVDYEQQNDVFSQKSHPSCIPLNTYTMGSRSHYYRT